MKEIQKLVQFVFWKFHIKFNMRTLKSLELNNAISDVKNGCVFHGLTLKLQKHDIKMPETVKSLQTI